MLSEKNTRRCLSTTSRSLQFLSGLRMQCKWVHAPNSEPGKPGLCEACAKKKLDECDPHFPRKKKGRNAPSCVAESPLPPSVRPDPIPSCIIPVQSHLRLENQVPPANSYQAKDALTETLPTDHPITRITQHSASDFPAHTPLIIQDDSLLHHTAGPSSARISEWSPALAPFDALFMQMLMSGVAE